MPGGNQITLPDSGARSTLRPNAIFAVRWVFPAPDGPLTSMVGERTVLGRGDDCDTVLAGSGISRYHAEMMRMGPVAMVRDLDSMNGLFVNGRRVKEAPLEPGDVLRLGEWVGVAVELERGDTAPAVYGTIASGLFGGNLLRAAVEPALRAARSDLPIIVEGETGTGKEVVARAVHEASGRSGAFLAVNCAALPEQLAEAELFGYRRGAFTGRRPRQPGALPVGAARDAAARRDQRPAAAPAGEGAARAGAARGGAAGRIAAGAASTCASSSRRRSRWRRRWRTSASGADLYARLEGLTVRLPPLRDRLDDVPGLFARLLRDAAGGKPPTVEPRLVEALCLYDWPFNVRELVTLVRRMMVLHGHEPQLGRRHLPTRFRVDDASGEPARAGRRGGRTRRRRRRRQRRCRGPRRTRTARARPRRRDDEDFARLLVALRSQGGNVSRAAGAIGISRQRAYRLMQAHPEVNLPGLRGTDGKLRGTPGAG